MTLNDFIKTAVNSDRLLILDSNGKELYRGFIGCLQYRDIDGARKVKQHGISTEVYTTKTIKKGVAVWKEQGERVPEESWRQKYRVRSLTPLECERLDGFPDGWTQYGASGKEMSSNARIKALGNSIAVPCAERVFIGILAAEKEVQEHG